MTHHIRTVLGAGEEAVENVGNTKKFTSSRPQLQTAKHFRGRWALLTLLLPSLLLGCGGGGGNAGGGGDKESVPPPSNLVYPQTAIKATVGQAITPDTPTVVGAVSSFNVSPSLPDGLTVNSATGAIAGTPTAVAALATYTVTASNASGSTSAIVTIVVNPAAPFEFTYPQTTIVTVVGKTITPDTPSVGGTISSFSVTPALPAGLVLNTTTGTISGTPLVAAQGVYTVTATNTLGSASVSLHITVTVSAPVGVRYPGIIGTVGQPITPDIPSVMEGVVSAFSIQPALPEGLSLNPLNGVISGTPTAAMPETNYTVTASNAVGSTTAIETITILEPKKTLLELGHVSPVLAIRFDGERVLSADTSGHWIFWDYTSGGILVDGDGYQPNEVRGHYLAEPIDMAGPTVVVGIANGLEVRARSDGHLLSLIAIPGSNWWKLASDGSYLCIGTSTGLFVYTLAGNIAASRAGDYSQATVFAAPGQVFVALGPAGQNVIETISTLDGSSTVSPEFSGQFNSWFADGGHFLTNLGTVVWVYTNTAVQQAMVSLPTILGLAGQGNWIWTYEDGAPDNPVNIYQIGSETPALTFNGGYVSTISPSGPTIVVAAYSGGISIVDLSGPIPTKADYPGIRTICDDVLKRCAFAAVSSSQWMIGYRPLLDGASVSGTPRYFGQGYLYSIAGAPGSVATSTEAGNIQVFDPYQAKLQETINFPSSKLALSSDGTVLGASGFNVDQLNFYSLPSGNVISSFPNPDDFTLAASGTTIGRIIGPGRFTREVTSIIGGSVLWSDSVTTYPDLDPILLSPDGTLVAVYTGTPSHLSATNIYRNGNLVTAVPGVAVGWIDNDRLLVNQYTDHGSLGGPIPDYAGCKIYSPEGVLMATPALPELKSIQTVNSDSVYEPSRNAIYSLTTGQPTWTGSLPSSGKGAISGAYVVYQSGHRIVVESY